MAQTSMTVRIDNKQKALFDKLCEQFGMSANTAINIFVRTVIRTKSIPFAIKAECDDNDRINAINAFQRIRAASEKEEMPEFSLEEINAEIKEARRTNKTTE